MKKILVLSIVFILNTYIFCSDWYDVNRIYYKLTTNKSGICKVSFNDLYEAGLDLKGKDTSGICLVYCNEELPYYYYNNELIYCIPNAKILDEYSNNFVVFLYYDENSVNHYNNIFLEADNIIDTIEYIEQNLHLEVDKEYFSGFDNMDYDYTLFKGWYWKILNTHPNMFGVADANTLRTATLIVDNIYIFPQKNSDINVKAYLTTTISNSETKYFNSKRNITSYLNNDSITSLTFDTLIYNKAFETNIKADWSGNNALGLVNYRTSESINEPNNLYLAVNSIDITGYFKPYFYNLLDNDNNQIIYQSNTLNINSIANNSLITINGLSDSKLYLYDSISKSFIIKDNSPVTHISICTKYETDKQSFLTNILINNYNYKSNYQGIHIAIQGPKTNTIDTLYSYSYNSDVLNFLQKVPDGSIVCIAINEGFGQINQIKTELSKYGCTKINEYNKAGDTYIGAYKKGSNIFIEDINKNDKIVCKDTTFYDEEKRWFAADVNLIKNKNYLLIYSDSSNISVAEVRNVNQSNLKNKDTEAELVIIYHNDFKEKSIEYANYKKSKNMLVECVDVEDIYKEFGFGNKSPFSIKNYLRYVFYNWKLTPKYVLFIGDASIDPRLCDTGSVSIDYVPTYGNPVSDYWFGIFDSSAHRSDLIIGRIPVSNNMQLENYIEKVKVYENIDNQLWNKKFMFVNGGEDNAQISSIENYAKLTSMLLPISPLCCDTITFYKTNAGIIYDNKNEIIKELNNGVGMTIFHGHGSTVGLDNWGWQVDNLYNYNKYGILATLSCNTGDFADNKNPTIVNEDFILSYKDRGFVAALGATTKMTIGVNRYLQLNIVDALTKGYRRIGDIITYSKSNIEDRSLEYNFGILGDPTIELKIDTLTDIYSLSSEVIVTNESGDTNLTDNNTTITIKVPIYNAGVYYGNGFNVKLEYDGQFYTCRIDEICRDIEVEFTIPLNTITYQQAIIITLDSDNEIEEANRLNNIVSKTIRVLNKGLYPIEPLPYLVMNKNKLHFRFLKWEYVHNESYLFNILDENNNILCFSASDEIYFINEYVDWNCSNKSLQENVNYFINVKQFSNNILYSEKTLPFSVSDTINTCDTCAELIFMADNTGLDTNYFLRGDTAFLKIDLANISLRSAIENVILNMQIDGNIISNDTIKIINPDEHILFNFPIPTTYLQTGLNHITATIYANDLYDFNNSYNKLIYVEEDVIAPTFKIYIDNDLLTQNTMDISAEPYFIVEMYDNSCLPILIEKPISVRLNGMPLSKQNTQYYKDTIINEAKLKAILEFKTEVLTEKENLFRFIGIDASGNSIDTNYRLTFVINNNILSTSSYPLPSSNSEEVYIEYNLIRSGVGGSAILNIYDMEGKHIKEIVSEINSSQGVIIWQKDDKNGKKVAPAVYSYTIEVLGNNWMIPIFGKIILAK